MSGVCTCQATRRSITFDEYPDISFFRSTAQRTRRLRCASIGAMRAATIRDGEIGVQEHPDPEPQGNELLVRVHAAGLNGADIHQLLGGYPAPPGSPQDIPGLELAGEAE